jgi:ATP-binding protein involved in chromosome partitioning
MPAPTVTGPTLDAVQAALATVDDPEIRKPITDLGMVKSVDIDPSGQVTVAVYLTVAGCPMRDTITKNVTAAVSGVEGVTGVIVDLDVMSATQRQELQGRLRSDSGQVEREIPFARPGSLTRVYAVASGKGGVGKSSVTVNLAAAMARDGLAVGVVDADIYGHSVPRMLGVEGRPTQVEDMILPPVANDVKVISIGMFVANNQPVVWRGPMLHRALQQFLGDVYWGDLDVLLMDLPPGTGDIAISVAQLVPPAELLVVTTPQQAAAEVAERAGTIALQTHQQIAGVVENMSWLPCPHCDERIDVFGSGGGQAVADGLTRAVGAPVPLLGQIPLDTRLREGSDSGRPLVLTDPDAWPAAPSACPPPAASSPLHDPQRICWRNSSGSAVDHETQRLGDVLVVARGGGRAVGAGGAGGPVRRRLGPPHRVVLAQVVQVVEVDRLEDVLADQAARVEVTQRAELGAQLLGHLVARVAGHLPDRAQHPRGVRRIPRQLLRTEDDQRDDRDPDQLAQADVEGHLPILSPSRAARPGTSSRVIRWRLSPRWRPASRRCPARSRSASRSA